MATISKTRVANATLSTTTMDTVTLAQPYPVIEVVNRSASGYIWVRASGTGAAPPNPTAAGDDCDPVGPGERIVVIVAPRSAPIVKVIGNGQDYSVVGASRT